MYGQSHEANTVFPEIASISAGPLAREYVASEMPRVDAMRGEPSTAGQQWILD